jgi:hypothetical protein
MGRIEATSLAHERSLLATNPAATCEHSNRCDSVTNWCLALVCRPDSARLPPSSTALAGAGRIGGCFAGCLNAVYRSLLASKPFSNSTMMRACPSAALAETVTSVTALCGRTLRRCRAIFRTLYRSRRCRLSEIRSGFSVLGELMIKTG